MKVEDVQRLERTEKMMVRWMCGVTLKDRCRSDELRGWLGIETVTDVVRKGKLGWFGHLERKKEDDWVSSCRNMVVEGKVGRGRGKKKWREVVENDIKKWGLSEEMAKDRGVWGALIAGKRPTCASTEKRT